MYLLFILLLSIITIYYLYSAPQNLKRCIIQGSLLDNGNLSYVFMEKTYYILNKSKDIKHFGIYSYTKLKNNIYILKMNNRLFNNSLINNSEERKKLLSTLSEGQTIKGIVKN